MTRGVRWMTTLACCLACCLPTLLLAGEARAGIVKLAVVIGNNRGHEAARRLRYAERDARKFYDVLVQLGGFSPGNISLLTGRSADEVWQALQRTERRLQGHARQPGQQVMLVIFYSGHADGSVLELNKTSLSYRKLTDFMRRSRADVRLAFVDSCRSGQLVAAKGGQRGPGYQIQVADEVASSGYAIITSSAADELSQESAEIRGSFFTNYLVSALRGAGDQSGDGQITLNEAYRYVYARTVARTSATVGGSQHPMYDFKLAGHGDIVLTRDLRRRSMLEVASRRTGRLVVLNADADAMVAETRLGEGRATRLALNHGPYNVYLLSKGAAYRARVSISSDRVARLTDRDFIRQRLGRSVAKGGLFRWQPSHRLLASVLLRNMPLEGGSLSYGAALTYRIEVLPSWLASLRTTWATAPDVLASSGYFDLGVQTGVSYLWRLPHVSLEAGILAGYEHMFQKDREDLRRDTSAFSYGGRLGIELPLGGFLLHVSFGGGARLFRIRDQGLTHRMDLQGLAGAGWCWGQ